MPTYDWICFRCEHTNPSGSEVCVHCGSPANIKAMKLLQDESAAKIEKYQASADPASAWAWFCFMVFGVLLIVGGTMAVRSDHWPAFMPLQLDLLERLFGLVAGKAAPLVVGLLAIVFGIGCLVICVLALFRDSE